MTNWRLIHADEVTPQAWRNGGGVTRELLAWPQNESWQVRISVADIEADGPFSAYDGVQRWFAVLEGAGVDLDFGSVSQRMTLEDEPLCFDGARAPYCRLLHGPTRDLNLMLRDAHGAMHKIRRGSTWHPDSTQCGLFTAVPGRCLHDETALDLPARALLWFDSAPRTLAFVPAVPGLGSIGWWISASPVQPEEAS
jgi:uncharacterized protein